MSKKVKAARGGRLGGAEKQQFLQREQERERAPARIEAQVESVTEAEHKKTQSARYYLLCDLSRTPFGREIHNALQDGSIFSMRTNCPKCPSGDVHIQVQGSKINAVCTSRDCMSYEEF